MAAQEARGVRLWQGVYADRSETKSHAFHDFASLGIADERFSMHYSFWAAFHEQGVFLVDTGFFVPDMYWAPQPQWRPVPAVLAAMGIDPEQVAGVILTHYHFDHAGHVELFPRATLFAQRREHEHWASAVEQELRSGFVEPRHLAAIQAADAEGRLVLVDGTAEVVPGITMVLAPGHTPGQSAVLVRTASGPRLLASDAIHLYEQLDLGWRFFAHTDAEQSDRTIASLRELSEREGAPLVPGHDSRVMQRLPARTGPTDFIVELG